MTASNSDVTQKVVSCGPLIILFRWCCFLHGVETNNCWGGHSIFWTICSQNLMTRVWKRLVLELLFRPKLIPGSDFNIQNLSWTSFAYLSLPHCETFPFGAFPKEDEAIFEGVFCSQRRYFFFTSEKIGQNQFLLSPGVVQGSSNPINIICFNASTQNHLSDFKITMMPSQEAPFNTFETKGLLLSSQLGVQRSRQFAEAPRNHPKDLNALQTLLWESWRDEGFSAGVWNMHTYIHMHIYIYIYIYIRVYVRCICTYT